MLGPLRDIGPCQVWYGAAPAKIGEYYDSVGIRVSQEDADVFESAFGTTPVDAVVVGCGPLEITVPFTRMDLADLAIVLPGGRYYGTYMDFIANEELGRSEYDNAAELILKPIVDGAVSATTYWYHVPKAYPKADYTIDYNARDQRVFNTVFKGFPDATSGLSFHIGPHA